MRIAAVVVNHNTPQDCAIALSSIRENSPDCTVVVVNVACRPEGVFCSNDSRCETVDVTHNVGFGTANNIGVSAVCSEWDGVLLLNSDARLHQGCLDSMIEMLDATGSGAVGPRIFNGDGSTQFSCARPAPTPSALCGMYLSRASAAASRRWIMKSHLSAPEYDIPANVAVLSGACILLSRAAWEEVGGFDERIFLYWEDVDLCLRLGDAGWSLAYQPAAYCTHIGGQSGHDRVAVTRAERESALLWSKIRFGPGWTLLVRFSMLVEGLLRTLQALLRRRNASLEMAGGILRVGLSRIVTRPFMIQALGFSAEKAGGFEAALLEQCDLARIRHGLSSVVCLDGSSGWLASQLRAHGHAAIDVGAGRRGRIARQCNLFTKVMRRYSVAAVVGHFGYVVPAVLLAAAVAGVPSRTVVRHSLSPDATRHSPSVVCMRLLAKRWVAVSPAVQADLVRIGVPDRYIVVCSVGLAATRIPTEPAVIESWTRAARTGIVALSEARPEKGLDYLVRAMAHPDANDLSDATVSIYGGGQGIPMLRKLISELRLNDRVLLAGRTDNAVGVLMDSALLVLPSLTEAAPVVLLESMATGTPIVATDVGGVGALTCGVPASCCTLIPVGDVEALVRSMTRALRYPPCVEDVLTMRRLVLERHLAADFHSAVLAGAEDHRSGLKWWAQ